MLSIKKTGLLLCAVLAFTNAQSQKLPNVQQAGLRAPANIKIDGKPTEWGKFAAYNAATSLRYTMANDDKNLYLAIQADDPNVLTKITNCGVLLIINPSGQKSDEGSVSINYPVFELRYNTKPFIRFSNTGGLLPEQRAAMAANPDSMLNVANKRLHASDKFIRTGGIPGVDTLLSVYNDKDIVAHEEFEKGMIYNYEIAIPLKYLNLPSGDRKMFAYHIVLNGMNVDRDMGLKMTVMPDGKMAMTLAPGAVSIQSKDMPAVTSKTDFWGEYILAK